MKETTVLRESGRSYRIGIQELENMLKHAVSPQVGKDIVFLAEDLKEAGIDINIEQLALLINLGSKIKLSFTGIFIEINKSGGYCINTPNDNKAFPYNCRFDTVDSALYVLRMSNSSRALITREVKPCKWPVFEVN